ncbi:MAG: substrate-binding domain-containing protein [Poseidonibacter sp.]|uniref:substrate-binding domain-containing protein n=1 Tax=Poseidonibacter sp. TaxID=2321188 RepID=UPI00359EF862
MKIILLILLPLTILMSTINSKLFLEGNNSKNIQEEKIINDFKKLVEQKSIPLNKVQDKEILIYMIYPGSQISDYWRRSKISFEKRLKELNIKYKLVDYFFDSSKNKREDIYLYNALQDSTDYIIFTLDAKKHIKFIETILSKDKPKLILQNITKPIKGLAKQPLIYDGFDHNIGSVILAKEYLKRVGGSGKYGILYGTVGYVSTQRGDSFKEYINENSNLKLADSYYTGFNKAKAKETTKDLLDNHKDINFIYACSTDIALGAVEVLEERGLIGKVLVNGWGGGSAELKSIQERKLNFTVMRINDDNGVAMAEAIKLDISNNSNKIPQVYSGDFKLITQETDKFQLLKIKEKAFRYSGL